MLVIDLEEEDTPDGSEVEDSEDIPIRLLTDFVIYDLSDNMRLVRFDALLGSAQHQQYGASGEVTPCIISNESDDETVVSQEVKSQRVSLTKIKEVNVHWVNEERRNINLDPYVSNGRLHRIRTHKNVETYTFVQNLHGTPSRFLTMAMSTSTRHSG